MWIRIQPFKDMYVHCTLYIVQYTEYKCYFFVERAGKFDQHFCFKQIFLTDETLFLISFCSIFLSHQISRIRIHEYL